MSVTDLDTGIVYKFMPKSINYLFIKRDEVTGEAQYFVSIGVDIHVDLETFEEIKSYYFMG